MSQSIFARAPRTSQVRTAFSILELIYHNTARSIRKGHEHAVLGLLMDVVKALLMIAVFYGMYAIFDMRRTAIRGDFLLFIMSGVFMYMTFNKGMGAVMGAEGATSAMMKHSPMSTAVALAASALAGLYQQVLSVGLMLLFYHCLVTPVVIDQPLGVLGMMILAWFTGCCFGMVVYAAKPWAPYLVNTVSSFFRRANMFASGKMFVANTLPGFMLAMFDWNPLFHIIDQTRGYMFLNYYPRYSDWGYALKVGLVFLMVGLMLEFVTRRSASLSWFARGG